jgi:ubiquinone/menaquinone biosynthesis C-methylase UbiE
MHVQFAEYPDGGGAPMFSDRVVELLVCPISKARLTKCNDGWLSEAGFFFAGGDFRVDVASDVWARHQHTYERWVTTYMEQMESNPELLEQERHATDEIYQRIELGGLVLDVGGGLGTVTHHAGVEPDRYLVCDPLKIDVPALAAKYPRYFKTYSQCLQVERVLGMAECLPMETGRFDTVHMRSCLDHMANPTLALFEAYRVLRPGGKLVVGLSLAGSHPRVARTISQRIRWWIKDHPALFRVASAFHSDPHVFHPQTADELVTLIEGGGFEVTQIVEQSSYTGVVYTEALRRAQAHVGAAAISEKQ